MWSPPRRAFFSCADGSYMRNMFFLAQCFKRNPLLVLFSRVTVATLHSACSLIFLSFILTVRSPPRFLFTAAFDLCTCQNTHRNIIFFDTAATVRLGTQLPNSPQNHALEKTCSAYGSRAFFKTFSAYFSYHLDFSVKASCMVSNTSVR